MCLKRLSELHLHQHDKTFLVTRIRRWRFWRMNQERQCRCHCAPFRAAASALRASDNNNNSSSSSVISRNIRSRNSSRCWNLDTSGRQTQMHRQMDGRTRQAHRQTDRQTDTDRRIRQTDNVERRTQTMLTDHCWWDAERPYRQCHLKCCCWHMSVGHWTCWSCRSLGHHCSCRSLGHYWWCRSLGHHCSCRSLGRCRFQSFSAAWQCYHCSAPAACPHMYTPQTEIYHFYVPQLYWQVLLWRVLAMAILSVCLSVRLGCHDPVPKQAQVR